MSMKMQYFDLKVLTAVKIPLGTYKHLEKSVSNNVKIYIR